MHIDDNQLRHALTHNGYDEATATARVPLLVKFFTSAKLFPQLVAHPSGKQTRQIEFRTEDTSCSVEYADVPTTKIHHPPKLKWLGGTWLETAPLTYLARVCDIGRRLLGDNWTESLSDRFINRKELLDVLNEIWWLGCWRNITNLHASPEAATTGDNDWRFTLVEYDVQIVLQVKRRRNDLVRLIHPTRPPYGLFDKLSQRFSVSGPNQINVGAITIYAGMTNSILRSVDDYFRSDESKNVDAVVLWSVAPIEARPQLFLRSRKLTNILRLSIAEDPLDSIYDTIVTHPISLNEASEGWID